MSPSLDAKMVFLTDSRNLELLCSAVASLDSDDPAAVRAANGGNWSVTAIRSFALSPETTGLSE